MGHANNIELSKGRLQERYIVGKILGYGSFGEIRKVKDRLGGRMAAVKIMTKRLMLPKQIARVYYEIELLKRFEHPNILKIYEYYETKEKIYIVLEYCEGEELFDRIRSRGETGFEENEVATIIQQIISGVNYLH
mmetsp:Transcript_18216/g.22735  ORF Transcript_18216/g.22735 Transcript_18216/m.22735 type:complete len:135 (+) Transcript_18216:3-407(+)